MSHETDKSNLSPTTQAAVERFILLSDDLEAAQSIYRRTFFELLLTGATLTKEEIQLSWNIMELLAGICQSKQKEASQ